MDGANTPEYIHFQKNSPKLIEGLAANALTEFAVRAFQKNLIDPNNRDKASNEHNPAYDRAARLISVLHSKIKLKKDKYYEIVDIFLSIPALKDLAALLQPESSQASGSIISSIERPLAVPFEAPPSSSKLKERPSNANALKALLPVKDQWKNIGQLLGLTPATLNDIEQTNITAMDRLREMVNEWLKGISVNWQQLIDAVKDIDSNAAQNIEKKFIYS